MHLRNSVYKPIFHLFFKLPEEIKHFYILSILRTVLSITGGLFLPLFIYESTGNLSLLLFYLLISQGLVKAVQRPLNLWILRTHGAEFLMFLSILLSELEYALIYALGISFMLIIIYGIIEGLSIAFYWDSYHVSFGLYGREKYTAEERAGLGIIHSTLSITLPILSAVVISYIGFRKFYATIAIITSTVSMYLLKGFKKRAKVDIKFNKIVKVPYKRLYLSEGILYTIIVLVPIFTYLVFSKNILLYGGLYTFLALIGPWYGMLMARHFDKKKNYNHAILFFLGNSFVILVLVLYPTVLGILLFHIGKMIFWVYDLLFMSAIYILAKKGKPEIIIGRSMYISVSMAIGYLMSLLLYNYLEIKNDLLFLQKLFLIALPAGILSAIFYKKLALEASTIHKSISLSKNQ